MLVEVCVRPYKQLHGFERFIIASTACKSHATRKRSSRGCANWATSRGGPGDGHRSSAGTSLPRGRGYPLIEVAVGMQGLSISPVITQERPDTADARTLIAELEAHLAPLYPRESRHGYSVEQLLAEAVAFFLVREAGVPAGCGAVKMVGSEYAEVKRMYIRPPFRGTGLAKLMLRHLTDYAQGQGIELLRLETGIHQQAAIGLYERLGFRRIPPFGVYWEDPLSRFYEKRL